MIFHGQSALEPASVAGNLDSVTVYSAGHTGNCVNDNESRESFRTREIFQAVGKACVATF